MSSRFANPVSLALAAVCVLSLVQLPVRAEPAGPAEPAADQDDLTLFVEPAGTEWLQRILPPLLEKLIRVAPYRVAWSSSENAVRAVASSTRRLALMRRSSVMAAGDTKSIEWFELGPASCMAFVVRQDAPWSSYGDLNYAPQGRLRVDLVSSGAQRYFAGLQARFPLSTHLEQRDRPSLIAVQRLAAKDIDLVVMDLPRRDASTDPPEALQVLQDRGLRLLDVPEILIRQSEHLIAGEVLVAQGWPWSESTTYRTLCDPFVLVMPAANVDRLVYALQQVLASTGEQMPPISPTALPQLSGPPAEQGSLSAEASVSVPQLTEITPAQAERSVTSAAPAAALEHRDAPNLNSGSTAQVVSAACDPAVPYVFTDAKSGARLELVRCLVSHDQARLLGTPRLTNDLVRMVQSHLNDLGFDSGSVDGVIGRRTRDAIRRFQIAQGMPANRLVSFQLLDRLGQRPASN